KLIGANNIIIKPKVEDANTAQEGSSEEATSENEEGGIKKFSPGLTFEDAQSIASLIPTVLRVGTVIQVNAELTTLEKIGSGKLLGVNNDYFEIMNLHMEKGNYFSKEQLEKGYSVCIIGKTVEKKLFEGQNPIGMQIKVKDKWLQIIGVVEEKFISAKTESELGIRNYNNDVYLPLKTYLLRFENRSRLRAEEGRRANNNNSGPRENKTEHQVDELTVQVNEPENLILTAQVIRRMLIRRHNTNQDFELIIPQQLIQQQQKTKDIFNIVLGVIAGISLLVGGIGIMNIMMASVTERTKEIGIRRSIGATSQDISLQFMSEAIIISLCGGILGILLGVFGAEIVYRLADIRTITSGASILVSFGVSVAVGLIFGISPAKRAAEQHPIEALRYE
ncbi:MAG TPA: FtsX-like permease family protein, partial [Anseongella sp.]|nr:FtsX-like permease family protein [Anseongella sp.]